MKLGDFSTEKEPRKKIDNIYELKDLKLNAGESAKIEIVALAIRDMRHTREVFSCMALSSGVHIRVTDTTGEELDINCTALSPHDLEDNSPGSSNSWVTTAPLLPGQGIMTWWHNPKVRCVCE